MEYIVELTPGERQILAALIGKHIDSVQDPNGAYSIRVCYEGSVIDFTPEDVATPEAEKPYADVKRPHITNNQSQLRQNIPWRILIRNLGVIARIQVLHTAITFTPLRSITSTDLSTLLIDTAEEYDITLHHPQDPMLDQVKQSDAHAVVHLDIGIALFIDTGQVLTIRTDGLTYFVESVLQDAIPDDIQSVVLMHAIEHYE
jgi:hypothetical protein